MLMLSYKCRKCLKFLFTQEMYKVYLVSGNVKRWGEDSNLQELHDLQQAPVPGEGGVGRRMWNRDPLHVRS